MSMPFTDEIVAPKASGFAATRRYPPIALGHTLLLIVPMIGFSMAGALAQDNGAVRTPSGDQAPIPTVHLLDVDTTSFGRTRTFFGRVTARKTVDLSFEVGGRLIDFSVPEGTRLMKGDVVARLDAAPFERALRRAELNLEQAMRELRRAERLAQTNPGAALTPSAILSTSDRAFEVMVFVPTSGDQGRVERRSIELGAPGGTSFRALGLNDGEQIVAAGAHLLTEGQTGRRYDGLIVEEK